MKLKLDGGEKMKKIAKIASGAAVALSGLYWSVMPAFAINLCPANSGLNNIPGCGGPTNVETIIVFAINVLLFVALVIALIFLIIGGIRWIVSGGDKEGTAKAKGTVTSALIGLVVVLLAWVLINLVLQILTKSSISNLNVPTF